jgi:putative phosphoribosyl transferase
MVERFADRADAGRRLAEVLRPGPGEALGGEPWVDPVVLGLARGGVAVAAEIARVLPGALEVAVARKIGAPGRPELGVGAVTADGPPLYDETTLAGLGLAPGDMERTCEQERAEARRRLQRYRNGRPPVPLADRDVVLVDDGVATGVTARAALRGLRRHRPYRLVLAVPVCAAPAVRALAVEADAVRWVLRPRLLGAVARWYEDFHQMDDDEVLELLTR